ncbi:MAG: lipid-A-disaccharide synthase [Bacteroidales bacterium]|nr:lipid-A-disaccharide synthase [Bacteroidales bacterium]
MRYYLIAGEASGDLHASFLMKALKVEDPQATFRAWGGDLMHDQGAELVKHYRNLAFMGFMEVAIHLPVILKNFRFCERDILNYKPDALILIDYPGFNLRMAKFASKHGIRVFYYISPQLWAWRSSRVKTIKKYVDRMFVILPFEKEFYAKYKYPVDFIGHPLLDVICERMANAASSDFRLRNSLTNHPIIALLPGSRKMEIEKMLHDMLSVKDYFLDYQFVIAAAPGIPQQFYEAWTRITEVRVVFNQTYDLLHHSEAALVTSGTATLETALMEVPQVVCYRGNYFSYLIARWVVKIKFISLVNLIAEKKVVEELIQSDLNKPHLIKSLKSILKDGANRKRIIRDYQEIKNRLGGSGASERAAHLMVQYLMKKKV